MAASPSGQGGILAAFARHPTAANILMVIMLVAGLASANRLNRQFFPDFSVDVITVAVQWPGASPEDIEQSVLVSIEPAVRFLDGVDRVISYAQEGFGSVVIEYDEGSDLQKALADVETAVAAITSLPESSERPVIQRVIPYESVASVRVSGPYSEAALRSHAKTLRDGLLDAGADKVVIDGLRAPELIAEVDPAALLALDLRIGDVARRIAAHSRDVPSGDTRGGDQVQLRLLGERDTAARLAELEIVSDPAGQSFRLGDIAEVRDGFADGDPAGRVAGETGLAIRIQSVQSSDILSLWDDSRAYLDADPDGVPEDLGLGVYQVEANAVVSRLEMLVRNGLGGLALVLFLLFVFLSFGVGFWVAVGIPAAFAATLFVMLASGQSINMVSMFALIMMLGIVVDDAIVVAEHAQMHHEQGRGPLEAAVRGARAMVWPVIAASGTTAAAFLPVVFMTGIIGQIVGAIPLVVFAVLAASLVECFLVLPGHLRASMGRPAAPGTWYRHLRGGFDRAFGRFRDGPFRRFVTWSTGRRYLTVACAVALFVAAAGLLAGGRVKFVFFPNTEDDFVFASFGFHDGTPRRSTEAMVDELERALRATPHADAVETTYGIVGRTPGESPGIVYGDHVGGLQVQLVPSEQRDIRAQDVLDAWRDEIRPLPGLNEISLQTAERGPPGRDIDIRLSGSGVALGRLKTAAEEVRALLGGYVGVTDIRDDLPYGKRELGLTLTPRGRALGFTTDDVAGEVRGAFEGIVAQRFPRGDEEVWVRVRFPRDAVEPHALDALFLRSPAGLEVPLTEVVRIEERQGFSVISREDGVREVAVTANADPAETNPNEVRAAISAGPLDEIADRYGIRWRLAGRAEEQAETLGEMLLGAMLTLVSIYLILALVFGSYARPLVVMAVVPFAAIGAVVGHWVMGFDLTIISLIGLLGLSGIVVNDSIIVVNTIDRHVREGDDPVRSVVDGSRERLRAVILTSVTTIGGLTPLLFETSFQAQFLQPMVITIIFGLMATTLLVLVLVPSLVVIQTDAGRLRDRLSARLFSAARTTAEGARAP